MNDDGGFRQTKRFWTQYAETKFRQRHTTHCDYVIN